MRGQRVYGAVLLIASSLGLGASQSLAEEAGVGAPAPALALLDALGQSRSLADYRGKYVVLEWFNPECPFVRKHYGSGSMQSLQREMTAKGVVWLSIDSSAEGKQGHLTPAQAKTFQSREGSAASAILLDPQGTVGQLYGAKSTPHMFVINPQGTLMYAGAIDDKPSVDPADVPAAVNYVRQALAEAMAGKPVSVPQTKSYGCSVKY